ncbi:unnamed protein product [Mucor hiemalis]
MVPSKQQSQGRKQQTNNEFIMYQQPIDYMRSLPSLSTVVPNDKVVENNMIIHTEQHSYPPPTSAVTPIPTQRSYAYINNPSNSNDAGGIPVEEQQHTLYNNQQHIMHDPLLGHQQPIPAKKEEPITLENNSLRFYQRMDTYPQSSSTHTFYSSQPLQNTSTANHLDSRDTHQQTDEHGKVYSFMPLESVFQQKRPRRKFNEIDRLYKCNYQNCTKAYGTLNHLNAHISMQEHGPKRLPVEFKELRKQLRKCKAEVTARNRDSITSTSSAEQQQRRTPSVDYPMTDKSAIQHGYPGTTPPPMMNDPNFRYRNYEPQQQQPLITAPNSQQQAYQQQIHMMQQQQQQHHFH